MTYFEKTCLTLILGFILGSVLIMNVFLPNRIRSITDYVKGPWHLRCLEPNDGHKYYILQNDAGTISAMTHSYACPCMNKHNEEFNNSKHTLKQESDSIDSLFSDLEGK